MAETGQITTSADNPYVITNPTIGFLNLSGAAGSALVEKDRAVLADLFGNNVKVEDKRLPRCNVLFLYCTLEPSTRVAGYTVSFRELIKGAGAHVAVLASDLTPGLFSNQEFVKALGPSPDWRANIVITTNRNGDHFGRFFHRLFAQMYAGVGMPMAWVQLAPQSPQQPNDIPGTIGLMEAGHIAFGPKKG